MAAWSRRWNAKKVKPLNKISKLLIDVILHGADELITSQRCYYLNFLSEMERSTSVSSQSNWRSQHQDRVSFLISLCFVWAWFCFVLQIWSYFAIYHFKILFIEHANNQYKLSVWLYTITTKMVDALTKSSCIFISTSAVLCLLTLLSILIHFFSVDSPSVTPPPANENSCKDKCGWE